MELLHYAKAFACTESHREGGIECGHELSYGTGSYPLHCLGVVERPSLNCNAGSAHCG